MSVRPVTTESYGTDRGGAGYLYTVLLLTILFAALKLSGVISWSWWWVSARCGCSRLATADQSIADP